MRAAVEQADEAEDRPRLTPTGHGGGATRGQPIGLYDTLVAAQALSMGLTVVTNNTRHFSRVPGLAVENGRSGAA